MPVMSRSPQTSNEILNASASFGGSRYPAHFGLGDATALESVAAPGPSRAQESYTGGEINRYHRVLQGTGKLRPVIATPHSIGAPAKLLHTADQTGLVLPLLLSTSPPATT